MSWWMAEVLMPAGLGGCTITLVNGGAAASLAQALDGARTDHFGKSPDIFVRRAERGVRED